MEKNSRGYKLLNLAKGQAPQTSKFKASNSFTVTFNERKCAKENKITILSDVTIKNSNNNNNIAQPLIECTNIQKLDVLSPTNTVYSKYDDIKNTSGSLLIITDQNNMVQYGQNFQAETCILPINEQTEEKHVEEFSSAVKFLQKECAMAEHLFKEEQQISARSTNYYDKPDNRSSIMLDYIDLLENANLGEGQELTLLESKDLFEEQHLTELEYEDSAEEQQIATEERQGPVAEQNFAELASEDSTKEQEIIAVERKHPLEEQDFTELEDEEPPEEQELATKRKRRKRRFVDPRDWKANMNKNKRGLGEEYLGRKENDYTVKKSKRSIGVRCTCKNKNDNAQIKCFALEDKQREILFNKFWELDWNGKKMFVCARISKVNTARARNRKGENSRRTCSYTYVLDQNFLKLRVCKTMFCNTLGISMKTVSNWLSKETSITVNASTTINESTINKSTTKASKSTETASKMHAAKENLKSFLNSLPKLESHYCRKSTSKLYLEPHFKTKTEVYDFYKENWCLERNEEPMCITSFIYMFEDMNLSLFSPKKDECDLCVAYRTNNVSEQKYQEHLNKKEEARKEKADDKESQNRVFTMDLQSVLLCPKSNVSALYYKTKLIVHNFTIYDLKNKDGFCYLWHEGEGDLSANCFTSIICNFIVDHVLPINDEVTIILYSDGCTAQNRNAVLSNALLNLAMEYKISIVQKYLEKGHTQMECDSVHSTIERKLKGRNINVPADYVDICKTARKKPHPYSVSYLYHNFFKNFNELNFTSSIRPGCKAGDNTVTDLRALKYNPGGTIDFKLRHVDEWAPLPCRYKKQNKTSTPLDQVPNLFKGPIKIKKEKLHDLMSLKVTIEKDYHNFYDNLKHD